jgi:hypothetical protein
VVTFHYDTVCNNLPGAGEPNRPPGLGAGAPKRPGAGVLNSKQEKSGVGLLSFRIGYNTIDTILPG